MHIFLGKISNFYSKWEFRNFCLFISFTLIVISRDFYGMQISKGEKSYSLEQLPKSSNNLNVLKLLENKDRLWRPRYGLTMGINPEFTDTRYFSISIPSASSGINQRPPESTHIFQNISLPHHNKTTYIQPKQSTR